MLSAQLIPVIFTSLETVSVPGWAGIPLGCCELSLHYFNTCVNYFRRTTLHPPTNLLSQVVPTGLTTAWTSVDSAGIGQNSSHVGLHITDFTKPCLVVFPINYLIRPIVIMKLALNIQVPSYIFEEPLYFLSHLLHRCHITQVYTDIYNLCPFLFSSLCTWAEPGHTDKGWHQWLTTQRYNYKQSKMTHFLAPPDTGDSNNQDRCVVHAWHRI